MIKKIVSAAVAFCLLFGSAAALPENYFVNETSISASAEDFEYENFKCSTLSDGTVAITGLKTIVAEVDIPSQINGKNVTSIKLSKALAPNMVTTKVTIPNTVKTIENNAFIMMQAITSLEIPSSVTKVCSGAFQRCIGLKTITFKGNYITFTVNESNGSYSTFNGCSSLQSVAIPNGVTSIAGMFSNCTSLTTISIPASVTTIGLIPSGQYVPDVPTVFSSCTALKSINVDSNNPNYCSVSGVLYNKAKTSLLYCPSGVTSVTVPGTLTAIPDEAFYNKPNLQEVTLQNGITTIGKYAFAWNPKLAKVTLPDTVKTIYTGAFNSCTSLKEITIPKSVTTISEKALGYYRTSEGGSDLKMSGLKVYGYTNSAAESYCSKNKHIEFIPIGSVACTHTYGTPTWTWNGNTSATATFTCSKCGDKQTVTANSTVSSSKAATCTAAGYKKYTVTVTFNGKNYTTPTAKTETIAKTGHNWNTPTWNWNGTSSATAIFTCSKCGTSQSVKASLSSKTTAATCTSSGKTVYTATAKITNNTKTATTTKTVTIDALGHKWGSPSYVWTQTSSGYTCTATRSCSRNSSHKDTQKVTASYAVTKQPTQTANGVGTYTAKFTSSAFTTQTKTVSIPKLNHTHSYSVSWKWNGTSSAAATFKCTTCGASSTVNATITSTTTPANCTTDGKTVYTAKATYDGKTETNTKTVSIAKLGHNYGQPSWKWNGTSSATATFKCSRCGASSTVNATITSTTTPATCTTDGKTVYTANASINGKSYTNQKTNTISKKGHKWGSVSYKWASDNSTCTASCTCQNDSSHKKTENATVSYSVTKQPTQSSAGEGTYTAKFADSAFAAQTKKITIPATSHTHSYNVSWTWNESNSATAKFTCSCGSTHFLTDSSPKTVSTTAATCTAKGSKTCTATVSFNSKTYTNKKTFTLNALGHKWGTPTYSWSSDNKSCTATRVCLNDKSHKQTETVKTAYKVVKEPTITAEGSATYTATFKNTAFAKQTRTVKLPVKAHTHTYANPTWKWNGTSSATASFKCTQCGTVKSVKATITHKTTAAKCTTNGKTVYTATAKLNNKTYTNTKSVTIKAPGHKWSKWSTAKKATCTTNGNKAYWYCSTCKKYFSDKNGKTEITKESTVIKATGHKVTNWTTKSFNVDKGTSIQTGKCTQCGKVQTRTVKNAVVRYAGANRYDTAAMLSKASHKTTSDTVIIADAMTFQDALIAVPLAKAYNAPLLLANPNIVTKQTEAELARLKAKKVIIVNTSNALKSGTINALKNKYSTQIIRGNNCFETSKRVAEELQKKTKKAPTDVFFTTNKAFADALSISPVAALKGAPILYVDPSKKNLDSNILAYLNKVKGSIKNVYIVGGKVAIPTALENSIKKALPKKNVKRFDGAQRYETCVMINKYFASLLNSKTVCVAKGLDFPDALAGGVFAANQKAPLLLADSALRDAHKSFLKDKKPNKLYIFGGTVAVPDKLAKEVAKASV